MPLKDLLWACPTCCSLESIDLDGRCRTCATRYQRGRGARITARANGSVPVERSAGEWLALLPWPDLDGEGHTLPAGSTPPFEQEVQVRRAGAEHPLRRGGTFLGHVELLGPKQDGVLRLEAERLVFTPQRGDAGWSWPLPELTAIQPASSAIQLKARGEPVVSIKFVAGSVRLWEQRLKYCTRVAYRAAGRGEITEYQPRIRVR